MKIETVQLYHPKTKKKVTVNRADVKEYRKRGFREVPPEKS